MYYRLLTLHDLSDLINILIQTKSNFSLFLCNFAPSKCHRTHNCWQSQDKISSTSCPKFRENGFECLAEQQNKMTPILIKMANAITICNVFLIRMQYLLCIFSPNVKYSVLVENQPLPFSTLGG